jgi:hypothetical protein
MTPRELEEYRSLRATIRERGTVRVWTFVGGFAAWAGLTIATWAFAPYPVATILPLLVLGAVFEAIFALHTGVERIGRYIQVFYEDSPTERRWEHTVMAFGRAFPVGGSNPLFSLIFALATAVNLFPAVSASPQPIEWLAVGAAHLLLLLRLALARRQSAGQRVMEVERFARLKRETPPSS